VTPPSPDIQHAADFLQRFRPGGPWVLTCVVDKEGEKKRLPTSTFDESQVLEMERWLHEMGTVLQRNVYFHVNETIERMQKKALRENIKRMSWLHVDVDPRVGEDLADEQKRISRLFSDRLPNGIPEPTCVVFSGGGVQGYWRLEEPFEIDGKEELYEQAKLWNIQIERAFKADTCHNVDRIMRLPGTVNWPDAKKRKKGREPALAAVVRWTDNVYDLKRDFVAATAIQTPASASAGFSTGQSVQIQGDVRRIADLDEFESLSDKCKMIINCGHDPDEPHKLPSRSEWLWHCVCEMHRAKLSDQDIYSIITDPGWEISGHVLDQADPDKTARRTIERAKEHAIHPALRELNEKHAVIQDVGGKCRVVREYVDPVTKRRLLSYQSFGDFGNAYSNRRISYQVGDKEISVALGKWWLAHPERRQFERVVFSPEFDVPGCYNLWKGMAFPAREGDCSLYLAHIRDNICGGNEEHYDYLIRWMAKCVQEPAQPGHVAVVLRGEQGTGKGVLAKTFGALFGVHFLHVSNANHVVGNFNRHLQDCVFLFGDEAFFAGDKKHESVLKALVTEELFMVEPKGVDAQAASNFVHLMFASNENWVVPAGMKERRFFVLDVRSSRMQDQDYFRKIKKQMKAGGFEALHYMLRTMDLSSFEVRNAPRTDALREQQQLSLSPEQDWWFSKLAEGEIMPGSGWPEMVAVEELIQDYVNHTNRFRMNWKGNATSLGMFIKKCFPPGHKSRGNFPGN